MVGSVVLPDASDPVEPKPNTRVPRQVVAIRLVELDSIGPAGGSTGIHRPDLATEEPEELRGLWRHRLRAGLFGGLFEWWTEGFDNSPRSWIRVLREALIDFLLERAYGGEGKPPDPGKRRREAALGYCLMVFVGLVILWAARQDDVSNAMATVDVFQSWREAGWPGVIRAAWESTNPRSSWV